MGIKLAVLMLGLVAAADGDYAWPDLGGFTHQLEQRLDAPLRVYKLELDRDGNADLWLQNPDRPDLIDSYELADGKINGPIPVKFEHYPSQEALDYHVIDAGRIDFARLPGMLAKARKELRMPEAELTRVTLERDDENRAIWTMRLSDPRHDGTIELELGGKVLHAERE